MPAELVELLRRLLAGRRAVGIDVCIYDPDLDPGGSAGDLLADVIAAALAG